MPEQKRLTRRQLAVIEDLFADKAKEQEVLDKHNVSAALYDRWLADERFCERFERRVAQAYREARLILARNAPEAARTLIELTTCEKEETARKACLDIVAPQSASGPGEAPATGAEAKPDPPVDLPPETVTRLLAALADIREEDAG
jgi:hypothetical protein